jgi:hypothetical protein
MASFSGTSALATDAMRAFGTFVRNPYVNSIPFHYFYGLQGIWLTEFWLGPPLGELLHNPLIELGTHRMALFLVIIVCQQHKHLQDLRA